MINVHVSYDLSPPSRICLACKGCLGCMSGYQVNGLEVIHVEYDYTSFYL